MSNLSENLKKIRKDNNLSQEQLAEKLGVSRQAISKWESNQAYPEMDKTIQLANMFNLNIDDLLNNDIREIKNEKESRNNINKYIDDFLSFITDTVNLFSNMSFKSKIKCIFEQIIIIFTLIIIFILLGGFLNSIYYSLFSSISNNFFDKISEIIEAMYLLASLIIGTVIVVHIFKTRYLDYYQTIKEKNNIKIEIADNKKEKIINMESESKVTLLKNEKKIIIRDPKHSEYRFINGLLKLIVLFIKAFALGISMFLCFTLLSGTALFIISFVFIKTGLFFVGILFITISFIIANIIILLVLLNFVFNRKSNKKRLIQLFITSIIMFGIGCGLTTIGFIQFDYIEEHNSDNFVKEEMIVDIENNMFFMQHYDDYDIEYIIEDRNNIRLEFDQNKYCIVKTDKSYNGEHYLWSECSNTFLLLRKYIKDINNRKIYSIDTNIYNLKVYTSKENIELLINNRDIYVNKIKNYYNVEDRIYNLEKEIDDYKSKISELENIIESYQIDSD